MERVGRGVAVFFHARRMPVAKRDRAVVAARHHAGAAALLLAAVDAVRKTVVGDDVVELRRRLVVPRAPRRAAVHADDRALVAAEQNRARILGRDPDALIVVAARGAARRYELLARGRRLVRGRVRLVAHVTVARLDGESHELVAAFGDAIGAVDV